MGKTTLVSVREPIFSSLGSLVLARARVQLAARRLAAFYARTQCINTLFFGTIESADRSESATAATHENELELCAKYMLKIVDEPELPEKNVHGIVLAYAIDDLRSFEAVALLVEKYDLMRADRVGGERLQRADFGRQQSSLSLAAANRRRRHKKRSRRAAQNRFLRRPAARSLF